MRGVTTALVFGLITSCGAQAVPASPCMSDRECRGERVCHQGSCMFEEEARAHLVGQLEGTDAAVTAGGQQTVTTPPDEADPPAVSPERPMFMGGPLHTGRSPQRGPTATPEVAWTHRTGARVFASPVVGEDGTIYVGSLDRTFNAISPTGELRWRYTGADKFYSTAAIASDGTIVVGNHDGSLVALTRAGQVRWRVDVGRRTRYSHSCTMPKQSPKSIM